MLTKFLYKCFQMENYVEPNNAFVRSTILLFDHRSLFDLFDQTKNIFKWRILFSQCILDRSKNIFVRFCWSNENLSEVKTIFLPDPHCWFNIISIGSYLFRIFCWGKQIFARSVVFLFDCYWYVNKIPIWVFLKRKLRKFYWAKLFFLTINGILLLLLDHRSLFDLFDLTKTIFK